MPLVTALAQRGETVRSVDDSLRLVGGMMSARAKSAGASIMLARKSREVMVGARTAIHMNDLFLCVVGVYSSTVVRWTCFC